MSDSLPPEIQVFFENRRKRTLSATLLDSACQVLSKGEFRPGIDGDSEDVFYLQSPQVLSDEQLALAALIQTRDEGVRIQNARHCWEGSEFHLHFDRVS